jgi:hypothetical protein
VQGLGPHLIIEQSPAPKKKIIYSIADHDDVAAKNQDPETFYLFAAKGIGDYIKKEDSHQPFPGEFIPAVEKIHGGQQGKTRHEGEKQDGKVYRGSDP